MKKIFIGIIIAIVIIIIIGIIDFVRVNSFEKPIFCVGYNLVDDGGSR